MSKNNVLTIIPAKSHSRRVPGKNTKLLGGKPLFVWAIEQAQDAGVCGVIHVATDSEEIAETARIAGADVPFLRKCDLDDLTSVGKAASNVVRRYRKELSQKFDLICLLLATSPLRTAEDIVACRDVLLRDENLDAAGSVAEAIKHPAWAWKFDAGGYMVPMFPEYCEKDGKDLPKAYWYDGAVYWAKADYFEAVDGNQYQGTIAPYVMKPENAVDIDTPLDFEFAEFLLSRSKV